MINCAYTINMDRFVRFISVYFLEGFHYMGLKFKDIAWSNYPTLKYNITALKQQVTNLYFTGLVEPDSGLEFTFIPTLAMKNISDYLEHLYRSIKLANHEANVCSEVFYSSKIEGANVTIERVQQLHDGALINPNNAFSEFMIRGGFEAAKYLDAIGNKIDKSTIRKCWEILTISCCNNTSIRGDLYRTGNVQVGNHVGLDHLLLEEMMDSWIAFYNSDNLDDCPFIKAAFLHYTFEHIHPFCDGNGRLGRLLMNNYLISRGYDSMKAVALSSSIAKNCQDYYRAFNDSDNVYTDCTPFIEYMLLCVVESFEEILK